MEVVPTAWMSTSNSNAARNITAKLKALRTALKTWSKGHSSLQVLINNCNIVIAAMDDLEEVRHLHVPERNFRSIIQKQLRKLLTCQQIYWRQRYIEKLVKWGR